MSFDPTIEPTVRDEIHSLVVEILMYVNVNIPLGLEKDLVDYIDEVNSSGDRPEYVPTEWEVLLLIVTRLLEIGKFTTDEDLNKMAEYYTNEWRA
tara:strand:- start:1064 stop:1348 length:285 start_codon:yes stop_codon:yes gene_type:complete